MKHVRIASDPGAAQEARSAPPPPASAPLRVAEAVPPTDAAIADALLAMARARRPGATFCPSEAARALAPADWRPLMPAVRQAAARLQRDGLIRVTQGGRAVDPLSARGPIRLSRPTH
ncbi:MAG: DUF3253 domain-containing protein [Pseudomonadota bacterium]